MPAWTMMSRNIGTSLATRSMWPWPVLRRHLEPGLGQSLTHVGLAEISSATFSSRLTISGGVFAGAISAV
mgnify:CR=1 FL=1